MKKKVYKCPKMTVVYSYDLDTELMYGNGLSGGGTAGGFSTGSNHDSTDPNPNIWNDGWDDGENGGSDL